MNLSIYNKLFLWSIVPFVILLFSLGYNLKKNYDDTIALKQIYSYLENKNYDIDLMHELAVERGLTVLYRTLSSEALRIKLQQQYKKTDQSFQILPAPLKLGYTTYLKELQSIRKYSLDFNFNTNAIFRKYSTLIKQINFKHRITSVNNVDPKFDRLFLGLELLITNTNSLGKARAYIAKVLNTQHLTPKDYSYIQELEYTITVNNKLIKSIINPTPLGASFSNFESSEEAQEVQHIVSKVLRYQQQMKLTGEIEKLVGYGGLIYNFDNYILRNQPKYKSAFLQQYDHFLETSAYYKILVSDSQVRYEALLQLEDTFKYYRENIDKITKMHQKNISAQVIMQQIHIDDSKAIKSLQTLGLFHSYYSGETWFDLATQHINNLHTFEKEYNGYILDIIQKRINAYTQNTIWHFIFAIVTLFTLIILNRKFAYYFTRRLNILHEALNSFFDYINYKRNQPQTINFKSRDEFSDMAEKINAQVALTQDNRNMDEDFIEETTHIVSLMKEGNFEEKSFFHPNNPSLKELQAVFNELTALIQDKIKAQTDELEMMNSSLEDTVYHQTLTLQEQIQNLTQLNNIIDSSAIVAKTTPEGKITHVNARYLALTGYTESEAVGKSVSFFIPRNTWKSQLPKMIHTIKTGEVFVGSLIFKTAQDERIFVDALVFPILNQHDEIIEYIGIFTDVTPYVKAKETAIAAEKSKDEFLANMSHEIRTPLNAILGFVTILLKRVEDEKSLNYLSIIAKSGNSLLTIINDILDFSKIQSGKFQITPHPFTPLEEFSHAILLFASKAYEKNIIFAAYIDPNLPDALLGDFNRVKQIVSNLLSNAIKFTPENGSIKIKVNYEKGHINVHVQDSGIGISQEAQNRIFKAFEQADGSTTREYGGTGLGLSISLKLAELMQGSIEVHSEENKGARFSLLVPMETSTALSTQHLDLSSLAKKSFQLLSHSDEYQTALELLKKYLKDFGITNITESDTFNHDSDSILIFVADEAYNQHIIEARQDAIVLLRKPSTQFSDYPHIYPLLAPFVPTVITETLEKLQQTSLIQESSSSDTEISKEQTFDGNILVAEDNLTNQLLISLLLKEYGLNFTIANDGLEAVALFKEQPYDLVLMDENMPNLNGLGALKQIRAYEKETSLKETPIVALTASVMPDEIDRFLDQGMNAFVGKPIDNKELEGIFMKYLTMRATQFNDKIKTGHVQ